MARFLSDEWFRAYIALINGSDEYRVAADAWEGDIAFRVEAEPDRGVPRDIWALLDLWHGSCRGGGLIGPERGQEAAYVLSAPYTRWKDVAQGELDPIRGMIQGKLKVRGDLPQIVRQVRAANELVHLIELVDTEFPDEA